MHSPHLPGFLRIDLDPNSDVLVSLAAQFGLDLQRPRGIEHRHEDLDQLDLVRLRKRLIVQQVRQLLLRLNSVRLACLALDTTKGGQE